MDSIQWGKMEIYISIKFKEYHDAELKTVYPKHTHEVGIELDIDDPEVIEKTINITNELTEYFNQFEVKNKIELIEPTGPAPSSSRRPTEQTPAQADELERKHGQVGQLGQETPLQEVSKGPPRKEKENYSPSWHYDLTL